MINNKKWQKNFYTLFVGQQVSLFTSMIVQYALIWYLTDQSKDATVLALSTIAAFLPQIIVSPLIGPLIDRTNKKLLLILGDGLVALMVIVLYLISPSGNLSFWLVALALFMRSLAGTIQNPAAQSVTPTIVPEYFVPKVAGLNGAFNSASMLVTPAIGAFFYGIMPISLILLIDVLGFLVGCVTVLITHIPSFNKVHKRSSYLSDLVQGFQIVKNKQGVFQLLIIGTIVTMLSMPSFSMYPLITTQFFKGTIADASFVEFTWAIGSLIGGVVISLIATLKKRLTTGILWYNLAGVSFAAMGFLPNTQLGLYLFFGLQIPAGIGYMAANGLFQSIIQQAFPAQQTGRAMAISASLQGLASPVGLLFAGPVSKTIGIMPLLVIAGIAILIGNCFMHYLPQVKALDHLVVMTHTKSEIKQH